MADLQTVETCMVRMSFILEQLLQSAETQSRFLQKRNMKGLWRVQKESDALMAELTDCWDHLREFKQAPQNMSVVERIRAVEIKQSEVSKRCREVMAQALTVKAAVAGELTKQRVTRQISRNYLNPWGLLAKGSRVSEKG